MMGFANAFKQLKRHFRKLRRADLVRVVIDGKVVEMTVSGWEQWRAKNPEKRIVAREYIPAGREPSLVIYDRNALTAPRALELLGYSKGWGQMMVTSDDKGPGYDYIRLARDAARVFQLSTFKDEGGK